MDVDALRTACELAAAIQARTVSSRELLQLYLSRVERLNPAVNAVVSIDAERAMEQAAAADEATARGRPWGPLHGLPVTVKDAIETSGLLSTGGAAELQAHLPADDAPAVAALRSAGAVVFGKTNVPRWSSDFQTFNDVFGVTNNPWDRSRTPGGSSGGAAAAVATGLTSFELGTDIAGSIRIPASFCGVFGHKPSFGVVPQRGYLDRVGGGETDIDINVFGPLARGVADLELLMTVLARPLTDASAAWQLRLPPPRHDSAGQYRVGVWLDDPACPVDREVTDVLAAAVDALAAAGTVVRDEHPPIALGESHQLFASLLGAAVVAGAAPSEGDRRGGSHRSWLLRDAERQRLRRTWAAWFTDHDALLCPVMPMAAFPHDHSGDFESRHVEINGAPRPHPTTMAWTGLASGAYLPATAVPAGRTRSGLPVGLQIVGPFLEDRTSLRLASIVSDALGGFQPPPIAAGSEKS